VQDKNPRKIGSADKGNRKLKIMIMKGTILIATVLCVLCAGRISGQQTNIPRIDRMPDMPSSYVMRNWKQTAIDFDNLVFDASRTGAHLPLVQVSAVPNGVNYPSVGKMLMQTYVGSKSANQAEAVNIIPAIVGASLAGVDKTGHLQTNWVQKVKEFFNRQNGENIYLNGYSDHTGNDWWYEIMPNLFFSQLYALYPDADADFPAQFTTVADRWLQAVFMLGGRLHPWQAPDFNHRALNLLTGATAAGVREPESAGSVAWILHQAYVQTGEMKYRQGAELALDFLQGCTSNPSYEIQLPYGIAAAARMNAELGTNYDIDRFLNWIFSAGQGTLRGWGTIAGNWNGYEMSGLIGEANDGGNDYAFVMNGFQHAAALAPVAKYDKRYARAIGKWILNLAAASRYFYPDALPEANQQPDSHAWAAANDAACCIPYEAIKQSWQGTQPRAMGDAQRNGWAYTDLSIYSGSSVGYLAAIVETTGVEGILQIDLNRTDFRGQKDYPSYLYYNPHATPRDINLVLPAGNFRIYDAISETLLSANASGTTAFSVPASGIRLLVIFPTAGTLTTEGRVMAVQGGGVVDWHRSGAYTPSFRIKSFSADKSLAHEGESVGFYCLAENQGGAVTYQWQVNGIPVDGESAAELHWTAPSASGIYQVKCVATSDGKTAESHVIRVSVIGAGQVMPEIAEITLSVASPCGLSSQITASATSNLVAGSGTCLWTCSGGSLSSASAESPVWTAPAQKGIYTLALALTNEVGTSTKSVDVLVKDMSVATAPAPLVYYPLNGDTQNAAQDAFHATLHNAAYTADSRGVANSACYFQNAAQYINTPNDAALNVTDRISLSLWCRPDVLGDYERFVISHGSWEERYKMSITPERHLRLTVKTDGGIVDVDDPETLSAGEFVHFTGVYSGYSLELYRNGALAAFKPLSGNIGTTAKDITLARKDAATTDYFFRGVLDEVRIYNAELPPAFIATLPARWDLASGIRDIAYGKLAVKSKHGRLIVVNGHVNDDVRIFDVSGKMLLNEKAAGGSIDISRLPAGIYFVGIENRVFKIMK
jgi:hypothetical protein